MCTKVAGLLIFPHPYVFVSQNWSALLGPKSVDIVYDTVGQTGTSTQALFVLRPGGYFVSIAGELANSSQAKAAGKSE